MLDSDLTEIEERLKPMVLSALESQSLGLRIISWQLVFVPSIPTPQGPRPGFGVYYQAKGKLIGPDYYVGNLSAWSDPWISQDGVDEAIRGGCEILRKQLYQQSIISDGRSSHE